MNFGGSVHNIEMHSSQMVTVLDSGLRDWVWPLAWVIALCPWPRTCSPSTSLQVETLEYKI